MDAASTSPTILALDLDRSRKTPKSFADQEKHAQSIRGAGVSSPPW